MILQRRTVCYLVGKILQVEALLLLLPLIVSLIYRESFHQLLSYAGTIALLVIIGTICTLAKPKNMKIMPRDGIVTVALSWILLSFFGGLPFVFAGEIPNLADAFLKQLVVLQQLVQVF